MKLYLFSHIQTLFIYSFIYLFIQTGDAFPVAFARSLVAISNHKDDNLRRICIETLRELSVENPRVVATVNGLTTLLDVVLEPSSQDMAEPILISLLYLLNDPRSRYCSIIYANVYVQNTIICGNVQNIDSEINIMIVVTR